MLDISNLMIKIKTRTHLLSPNTVYGVHLVFKFCEYYPANVSRNPIHVDLKYKMGSKTLHAYFAKWRDDQWMIIELYRFFNENKEDGVVGHDETAGKPKEIKHVSQDLQLPIESEHILRRSDNYEEGGKDSTNAKNISSDEAGEGQKRKAMPATKHPPKKKAKATSPNKERKGHSFVWDHFEKYTNEEGEQKATCNYCSRSLAGNSSTSDTMALKRHFYSCEKNPEKPKGQTNIFLQKNDDVDGSSVEVKSWKFCDKATRKAIARMVILDELPFTTVEQEGFRNLMQTICPNFKIPSRFTVSRDVGEIYLEEKAKLKSFFASNKARVCLTTDTWTSVQCVNYMCVTAHFIDDNWVLHKRVINFKKIYSNKGEEIAKVLVRCLKEWDIESVLTITTDNSSSNDKTISYLRNRLKNQLSGGKFLHIRCMAHIINLIVQDGLNCKDISIERIRDAIRYIRVSPKRLDLFKKCAKRANIESKALLCLDCPPRWNSTHEMLDRAEKLEKAFEEYDLEDENFRTDLGDSGVPSSIDWFVARRFAKTLEMYKQKTIKASSTTQVVVNQFFSDIMEIDNHIRELKASEELIQKQIGNQMEVKYEKYWRDASEFNMLLYFAAILDPRQKFHVIEFGWGLIVNTEKRKDENEDTDKKIQSILKPISDTFELLYKEYEVLYSTESSKLASSSDQSVDHLSGGGDFFAKFQSSSEFTSYKMKSELQNYLEDQQEAWCPTFDILQWWKTSSSRYPILSKMAKGVLHPKSYLLTVPFKILRCGDAKGRSDSGDYRLNRRWLPSSFSFASRVKRAGKSVAYPDKYCRRL
ncbi:hypothetical protein E3N88_14364 [Mikania micrantha]|uniref:BED-type domain-containing protein n=1 Tax=Mikania micrantha TaxID=192012 RepID=A0A5N6P191_9ASTR|nr:hypothetical protein E3N88_14364 [Mikania micrantha]